ncbi:hypothetical protein [Actinosynnema sp. NPDC023587]|uniref:hypothetical protein n=1 Tax=Actinosynnema sp. NPDC023587 TaxID=3154695 RepID=UPI0033F8E93E
MTNDGVGLPVRLHDLLLALAGRVDDDALTQARELLAVAELDRAVELAVGVLLAGRIPVSVDERREIGWLLGEVRSDRGLADKLFAVEQVPVARHRFTVESDPADGLAEVIGKTASVLPDVRSVRATWRSSPAGATPGPLPQRVVLVDIGPSGFAPATAYRVDTVLRQAGIRAAVEVLTVGVPLNEYHAAAVTTAREVFFQTMTAPALPPPDAATWFDGEVRDEAPVVEPEPVPEEPEAGSKSRRARVDPFEGAQPFPPKPVKRLPVREAAPDPVPSLDGPGGPGGPAGLDGSGGSGGSAEPNDSRADSHDSSYNGSHDIRVEFGSNVNASFDSAPSEPTVDDRPDSLNDSRQDSPVVSINGSRSDSRNGSRHNSHDDSHDDTRADSHTDSHTDLRADVRNDSRNDEPELHEDYPRQRNGRSRNGESHNEHEESRDELRDESHDESREELPTDPLVVPQIDQPAIAHSDQPSTAHTDQPGPAHIDPFGVSRPEEHPLSRAEVTTELRPDDLAALQAALAEGQAPSAVQLSPTVDAKLSDRERALLQQLHEELAQREQQSWPHGPEYVNGVHKPNNGKYSG